MIVLASNSPRRKEILKKFIDFSVVTYDIEENNEYYSSPEQLTMALSFEKGIKVAIDNPKDIVISADTIVTIDSKVMGKPIDISDAKNMLEELSGKVHEVITGYSIFNINKKIKYTDHVKSNVKFKELSNKDIKYYLDTDEYIGKAGAYAIQGYGSLLVEYIEGDFNNIVGLPISKISDKLYDFFGISLMKEVVKGGKKGMHL
ncbi:septum formation protein [Anaerosphaera aminiphila DSM 21120]|uniref:dTTP/UTP pyrophosphatase n=1 Tax=Anaerosphaera aminiphila DSM 21120 TaxID=1120995 RepID=A0A1M5PAK4_9FIRM|nr:nucleoside triphosphate pyrophosphatase [Anaerosphaera aminiphila]SHG98717.1 septum formation protein [Anaerosphaera aminiphila DSM 21120]